MSIWLKWAWLLGIIASKSGSRSRRGADIAGLKRQELQVGAVTRQRSGLVGWAWLLGIKASRYENTSKRGADMAGLKEVVR